MGTKKILLGVLLAFISITALAQNNVWYFGAANAGTTSFGLDFTAGGAPVQRNFESAIDYYESVTTVSDAAGNILYYSDGIEIYDGSHALMAGAPATLQGTQDGASASSVQGAFSLLKPGSATEYYLFTSQSIDGLASGFRMNRIDMSLPGNGTVGSPLGEVVTFDSVLAPASSEMMTAYGVCGTDSVWILTHVSQSYDFIRVLVTSNGVQSVQTQTIATPTQWNTGILGGDGRGSMDINEDGTKLIFTGQWPIGTHILDFNKSTGVLSNHVEVKDAGGATFNGYGCEFSPDGTKAYFTSNLVAGMWQYDLNTSLSANVTNSAGLQHGEIIAGNDGKLYVGKVSQQLKLTMGVISDPDLVAGAGATNYDPDGITFPASVNANVSYAMPQGFFCLVLDSCDIDSVAAVCDTASAFQFTATTAGGTWGGGPYITSGGMFDPGVAGGGLHWITFQGGCLGIDSVQIQVDVCCPDLDPNLGADVTICDDQTLTLDAGAGLASYQWLENGVVMAGQIGQTITADSGTYVVNVTDADGCPGTDTIEISNWQLPVVDLGPDTFYCATDSFLLDAGVFAGYAWTPNGEGSKTIYATTAGTYGVTVTDGNGCENTDNVIITERALPDPIITGNTIVCEDSTTLITGVAGSGGSLAWSGIAPFVNPLPVTAAGTYTLVETDASGCIDSVDYTLTLEALPAVELGGPYTFCFSQGNQLLDASTGAAGETYVWSDASTDPTLNVTDSSIVSVIVTSANGCIAYDTAVIDTFSLPVVDLGPDTFYCAQDSIQLDAGAGYASYAWTPNGESSQTVWAKAAATYEVTVVDGNGCTDVEDVIITSRALPVPTISGNTIVCQDSTTLITGTAGSGGVLTWSGIAPFVNPLPVTTAGTYTLIETDGNGCVDSVDYTLTLEALPAVDLGGPYTFCFTQGNQLLDASTGAVGETYVWSDASTDPTLNVTDSSIVSVMVTSANGCIAYDTAVIDTFSLPVVDLGPDTFYCALDSIQLDAGAGYANYVWTPNSETSQTIFAKSAATYGVTVTDANGCTDAASVIITENALPIVDLGPDTTTCEGDSIILDATHPDAFSYAWTPGLEVSATIKVGSTAGTYEVTITDVDGCVYVTDRTISEESLPIVDLGVNDTICDDLTKTLDAGPGYNYAWYLDGALQGSETSQTLAADSGTYVVSVTTPLGCETRDTILVDNFQLPVVDLNGPFEYCALDSVQIDASNNTATFLWSPTNETTQSIWAKAAGTFSVTVTDTNGCINSGSAVVSENANPVVDLGANDSACVGLNIPLDATIPNGVTYVWSNGHNQADYMLVGPDTLSVIATDANGCIGYDTLEIAALDSLELMLGDTTLECANDIQPLDAGSFQGASYTWMLPNGSQSGTQVVTPQIGGWYKINVTDAYNCKGEDSIFVVIIPVPNINLGPDTMFCSLGQDTYTIEMVFTEQITGTISWSEDNNNSNDTLFTATYAPSVVVGTFIDDSTGCVHMDSVELKEYCEPTIIKLPNIFVPGGTNNTTFHPIDLNDDNYEEIVNNIVSSEFEVFNRWGLKVFQSADLLPRWDGMFENRPVASGTYFWIYKYKDSSLKEYTLNGFVQVVQLRD